MRILPGGWLDAIRFVVGVVFLLGTVLLGIGFLWIAVELALGL